MGLATNFTTDVPSFDPIYTMCFHVMIHAQLNVNFVPKFCQRTENNNMEPLYCSRIHSIIATMQIPTWSAQNATWQQSPENVGSPQNSRAVSSAYSAAEYDHGGVEKETKAQTSTHQEVESSRRQYTKRGVQSCLNMILCRGTLLRKDKRRR